MKERFSDDVIKTIFMRCKKKVFMRRNIKLIINSNNFGCGITCCFQCCCKSYDLKIKYQHLFPCTLESINIEITTNLKYNANSNNNFTNFILSCYRYYIYL